MQPRASASFFSQSVNDVMSKNLIIASPDITVQAAGQLMSKNVISCLPIFEKENLVGVVTLNNLRDNVVAKGVAIDQPVRSVMSKNVVTCDINTALPNVLTLMVKHKVRYALVTEYGKPVGMLTQSDLMRMNVTSPVYLIRQIEQKNSGEEIAEIIDKLPLMVASLVESGSNAYNIGHMVTSFTDAITIRLLTLAEQKLGAAPIPYLWLACGSQGREEQTAVSDQDNCLILDDSYDEMVHGDYFKDLAKFVCDGLNDCGYVYCPGDMMAMNPRWRQPQSQWRSYFKSWVDQPGPEAQMLSSVMFDLRPIHGTFSLYETFHQEVLEYARKNTIFITQMIHNLLDHRPAIGFFGTFITESKEPYRHRVNLKMGGVVPVIDIARLYALEASIADVNTYDRLQAGREARILSEDGARDLLDAYEFISITRLEHQARQIRHKKTPDNFLDPKELSRLERKHLKDAFRVIKVIQDSLSYSHQVLDH